MMKDHTPTVSASSPSPPTPKLPPSVSPLSHISSLPHDATAGAMDASIGWQKVVQDLAGDNEEIREQLREITGWFPSIEMMRNHARGLIKVMREGEAHAFPTLRPTFAVILWAMRRCSVPPTAA
ncbi:hypothetical protein ZWY2020_011516 [Hordeum vulgare]|nr:hypothetical protein ZWY2020_011516 [Hordeum vulgare]